MTRFILSVSCVLLMASAAVAQNASAESPSPSSLARSLSSAFADVYEKVSPGVVVIEVDLAEMEYPEDASGLYQFFMQDPQAAPRGRQEMQQGSGFLMTADGYILTNRHVISGAAKDGIKVQLNDGRKFPAKLVGVDSYTDLAVIKIDADKLVPVELGDSDKVRVGEFAFALGAPFDLRYTFTYGIVSAKGRTDVTHSENYEEYLQTDASINPGNSGGPLVDIDGKVIGINTLINGINRGLGFAIPINIAKKIATQLIASGRAVRPYLGLEMALDERFEALRKRYPGLPEGVLVEDIRPATPADNSGLKVSDIIVAVDGSQVHSAHEVQKAILSKQVGEEVVLDVWRNDKVRKVSVRTGELSQDGVRVASFSRQEPNPAGGAFSASGGMATKTLTAETAAAMKLKAEEGALVTHVEPGSPAAAAGLQAGDVITSIDSQKVASSEDVQKIMSASQGDGVLVNFNRGTEKAYAILKF